MKLFTDLHAKQIHNKIQTNTQQTKTQKFPTFGFGVQYFTYIKALGHYRAAVVLSVQTQKHATGASDARDTLRPLQVIILFTVLFSARLRVHLRLPGST